MGNSAVQTLGLRCALNLAAGKTGSKILNTARCSYWHLGEHKENKAAIKSNPFLLEPWRLPSQMIVADLLGHFSSSLSVNIITFFFHHGYRVLFGVKAEGINRGNVHTVFYSSNVWPGWERKKPTAYSRALFLGSISHKICSGCLSLSLFSLCLLSPHSPSLSPFSCA